jgi:hypothetical protein
MSEKEPKLNKELPIDKEKKEEPKISYEILYSAHRTAKDFEKLDEAFPKCDIYVPECSDWTPEILADLQSLSKGEITPKKLMEKNGWSENASWEKDYEIIYQSQKPILFADLGMGHELEKIDILVRVLFNQSFEEFTDGNFPVALQKMREFAAKKAEYHQKREEIMKANLETKIKAIIENNPQFKNKEEIKVLLSLGAVHTPLFHSLKKEKPSTLREFANLPLVFISQDETIRRKMFSKEIKDELLAKMFVEHFLLKYFEDIADDSNKISRIVRKISSKISLDEIKKISENWRELDTRSFGLPPILIKFFRDKRIKIPRTEKEIDEILKPLEE